MWCWDVEVKWGVVCSRKEQRQACEKNLLFFRREMRAFNFFFKVVNDIYRFIFVASVGVLYSFRWTRCFAGACICSCVCLCICIQMWLRAWVYERQTVQKRRGGIQSLFWRISAGWDGDTVHIPVSELPLAAAAADATRPVYTFLNFCLLHRKKELVYYGVSQVFFFNYWGRTFHSRTLTHSFIHVHTHIHILLSLALSDTLT